MSTLYWNEGENLHTNYPKNKIYSCLISNFYISMLHIQIYMFSWRRHRINFLYNKNTHKITAGFQSSTISILHDKYRFFSLSLSICCRPKSRGAWGSWRQSRTRWGWGRWRQSPARPGTPRWWSWCASRPPGWRPPASVWINKKIEVKYGYHSLPLLFFIWSTLP